MCALSTMPTSRRYVRMALNNETLAKTTKTADLRARGQERPSDLPICIERSNLMSRIRQRGTSPELVVRGLLRGLAVSHRRNVKTLPGTPDIVLAGQKKAIVVHGCFWHRHEGCKSASNPKTRVEFWSDKFVRNIARDRKTQRQLKALGYSVMVIWECQVKGSQERGKVLKRLIRFTSQKATQV